MELDEKPLPDPPPDFVLKAVMAARQKGRAAFDAAFPAEVVLLDWIGGLPRLIIAGRMAALRVPDLLAQGPLSSEEIATRLGQDVDAMHRSLRVCAAHGLFTLRGDGKFENNRLSRALETGTPSRTRDFFEYYASASNVAAWRDFPETLRTGENAFDRVHGVSVWDWFDAHPHERETFAQAMMGMSVMVAPFVAKMYPFHELGTVCDVGGGRGTLLSELLVRNPGLKGILCDAPGVLDSARSLVAARGLVDRMELVPGSFFDEVPSGADAYLLKTVLHDWDDRRCEKILGVVRKAMKPGAKVLVVEQLVERFSDDPMGTGSDVQMMIVCGEGRERGREEFAALLDRSGFALGRVFEGPVTAVIEGVAR
ncbi:MAG: hypothetical protein JNL79_18655 [Myxococcales bacterium]|nr:hypothetical protein [Myxococcales bacterium]